MRDAVLLIIIASGALAALRHPWVGIVLWTWLSTMNPHRFAWGLVYDAPVAALSAGATFVGIALTRDKRGSPLKESPAWMLLLFMAWMTLSLLFGLDPSGDYWAWNKVMKIDGMILVALIVLHSKKHVFALAWVAVGSLAALGVKGGVFTLLTGGGYHVWGPPDSFIEDNNAFALALVMTIPLLRFLQLQLAGRWSRHAMTGAMLLCAASALGSQSRGALLALSAMGLLLWWRGRNRLLGGVAMAVVAVALVAFMPDSWTQRMNTIQTYETDASAMGRIGAWWNAWNLAFHYPFGVGFDTARPELFAKYSPYPDVVLAAHSIYFQVLGNHGFIGLFIFLAILVTTWRAAGKLRRLTPDLPAARWAADLGSMCQVSLIGYMVGGAFLSLAYFDLPYNVVLLVLVTRQWVLGKGWETEPAYRAGWRTIPGLAALPRAR